MAGWKMWLELVRLVLEIVDLLMRLLQQRMGW